MRLLITSITNYYTLNRQPLSTLIDAIQNAANETALQGGEDLKDGRHQEAERAVAKTRAMRDFAKKNVPALRRLWRSVERNRTPISPNARLQFTPLDTMAEAILQVLHQAGGTLRTAEALAGVHFHMNNQLLPADHDLAPSGQIRWQATARHARDRLVRDGLLSGTARNGYWKLTPDGKHQAETL